ncbi:FAD dependent oxidoreductase [Pyrenophora tritici-repentis]|uniref:FAD dependent oxidoreductase n=2 Tax=Pyrenophora tritici-repentis TaxID=45151 RepID=A0A2W1DH79_9PLEO|nr:FAD dependent oxidoreductase [Pyrenophora tritici-repentis Pt-1C-BFP]KAA8615642.1 FAD dependent oxidoreductase [Pyrenophora tritici-repentis]EDU51332.1 FAD dependent oxidoreductase [Pyrenophora tritici-repentis Pt-1C-BFP]KAF7566501.1 FAD dependent oxidoreductase [Pyrenophora tritici-repentis]KAI1519450.1 FAD dependent oxidoreductase [Pyrenophora tritici-repentis]KAI1543733.1 FAD dependent oxidoreductase [Pyrenophora tritici-repentis]
MDRREDSPVNADADANNTVILGCGIIGLCTAYYLTDSGNTAPNSIHLVDSSPELFRCASGLAAGFLSADWFAPSVSSLGALSFKLHASLAQTYSGRKTWGYSPSTGISLSQDSESESAIGGSGEDWLENGTSRAQVANHNAPLEEKAAVPPWLRRTQDGIMEVISREGTTAQIDPFRFCQWIVKELKRRGVNVHQPARAREIVRNEDGVLCGVKLQKGESAETNTELPCTRIVITSGAWSPRVFNTLFPQSKLRIPISSLGGHSLLVRNPHFKPEKLDEEVCHAVFATDTLGFSPEWFARLGGELYLAGLNSTSIPLPDTATDVKASEKAIEQLKQCAKVMMMNVPGREMEVLREGLCFRPVTSSGRPIVSRIPDEKLGSVKTRDGANGGVFIAAGHGAWGISHAPGTGLVLSELIEGRKTSAKIEALRLPL